MRNTFLHNAFPGLSCIVFCMLAIPAQAQQSRLSFYQYFSPVELTGNWVSVVTEDWHTRMVAPVRDDYDGLPLTQRAREVAASADLEKIQNDGLACMAYGAARILREPGRLKISWADDDRLMIETDAGQQTRLLHFDNIPIAGEPGLQGLSVAQWEYPVGFDAVRAKLNYLENSNAGRAQEIAVPGSGKLYVETGNLTEGMLRKNGVPTSTATVVKEYFNVIEGPGNTEWLIVTTIVSDPVNLLVDHITSTNFKRETDDAGWNPKPCRLL